MRGCTGTVWSSTSQRTSSTTDLALSLSLKTRLGTEPSTGAVQLMLTSPLARAGHVRPPPGVRSSQIRDGADGGARSRALAATACFSRTDGIVACNARGQRAPSNERKFRLSN